MWRTTPNTHRRKRAGAGCRGQGHAAFLSVEEQRPPPRLSEGGELEEQRHPFCALSPKKKESPPPRQAPRKAGEVGAWPGARTSVTAENPFRTFCNCSYSVPVG
ncbi:hypothetical protein ODE01S_03260 [Oceanithermus desulfurans NBRC 100063]|uniref:Uncharacterized protein n=1 Tax=Oceanithermus desulfurans NBRC 100063 TaxID=1227550 RepID=A0A511RIU4_9DEIN|nr:hypothetical protein ODE01S_03260 [Oceanithermus desulfurans NBRC 100063]